MMKERTEKREDSFTIATDSRNLRGTNMVVSIGDVTKSLSV